MKIHQLCQLLLVVLSVAVFSACKPSVTANGNSSANSAPKTTDYNVGAGGGATPTEAFKSLFNAVKTKNTEAIKANMSKTTIEFVEGMIMPTYKKSAEEAFSNGMTETTMGAEMPPMRDERIKGDFAALEVQNPKGIWEDLPFIKEDGRWKLAVGDLFKGSYQKPAPPASAANRQDPTMTAPAGKNPIGNTAKPGPAAPTDPKPTKPVEKEADKKQP